MLRAQLTPNVTLGFRLLGYVGIRFSGFLLLVFLGFSRVSSLNGMLDLCFLNEKLDLNFRCRLLDYRG